MRMSCLGVVHIRESLALIYELLMMCKHVLLVEYVSMHAYRVDSREKIRLMAFILDGVKSSNNSGKNYEYVCYHFHIGHMMGPYAFK